jgi:predicted amidohydrolase YtcJ
MKQISLLLFFIFPLCCIAQETVFYNAKIFTADPQKPFAEAIAINGKIITAVGNYKEVKAKAGANAKWIDLNGGFLMPGFIDSHTHPIYGGHELTKASFKKSLSNTDELLAYAKEQLTKRVGMTGDVLVIYGLDLSAWQLLDEINRVFNSAEFKAQPIMLNGMDGHTAWGNKVMMSRAGLNKSFIDQLKQDQKIYYGVNKDGEPSGFVSEEAVNKLQSSLIVETDYSRAAEKAMEYNNRYGITAWLDPSVFSLNALSSLTLNSINWYRYLIDNGKLTAHIAAAIVVDANANPKTTIDSVKALQKKYNTENFSIIGLKIFADGVIEHPTHTAALSIPYINTQSKGVLLFEPKNFARLATMADKENLLVHVHAIGDLAVTETLNGFEQARKTNKNFRIPHTITHLQIVQPADFDRFAQLNVLASVQLLWAFGDFTTIDIVKPYIDPFLYKWQYPARSLLQAGATICGASDWPVSSANPFEAIYNAETRKGPLGVLDSTQRMPRIAMLYAYTSEAAKALMLEKKIGSLQAGKIADMILLDRDVLAVTPEAMNDTRVLWTMFEGKKVFEALKK